MSKVKSTRHVLAVRDLAKNTDYFVQVLGFSRDAIEAEGWSFLSMGKFKLMLGECPEEMTASETHNHSYFAFVLVKGVDELYEQYTQNGATFANDIATKPWGMREFCVQTPEGHRMVFAEPQ